MSDIQKYAKSGKKYILKLNKNINISKQINVMNNTKLVIVSTGSDKFSLKVNNMSKDPNTYSDMFRVEKGSSLTLGDNEKRKTRCHFGWKRHSTHGKTGLRGSRRQLKHLSGNGDQKQQQHGRTRKRNH